jgi:hypothetical protein
MATLFPTPPLKVSWISRHRLSLLTIRFLSRLSVCLASTFGFGSFLTLYGMARILRACAAGDPMGFVGLVLVALWVQSLADMWQYVRRDFRRLWETRSRPKPISIGIEPEDGAQI